MGDCESSQDERFVHGRRHERHGASRDVSSVIARMRKYMVGEGLGPQLIRAVVGSAGVSIAGMGFTFLLGIQLARGLGAKGYGIYGLAMAMVSVLGVPSQFGLPQLLTREVAATGANRDWAGMKGILSWSWHTAAWTSIGIGLMVFLYVVTLGPSVSSELGRTTLIGVLLVPLIAFVALSGAAIRGLLHIVKGQLPDALLRPMAFSLLLAVQHLFAISLTPVSAMTTGVVSVAVVLLAATIILRRLLPAELAHAQRKGASREWFSAAMPMAMTEGMRVIQAQAGILILGIFASLATVGQFRVAASAIAIVSMPLTVVHIVAAPMVSRLHAIGDGVRIQKLLGSVAALVVLSTLILSLPFWVCGKALMAFVFGHEFAPSGPVMGVLCFGVVVSGALGVGATLLNMTGLQRRVTRASLISLVVLCSLLIPLGRYWGAQGAAWAVSIAMVIWNWVLRRDAIQLLGFDTSCLGLLRKVPGVESHG